MTLQRTGIALADGLQRRLADSSIEASRSPGRAVALVLAVLAILVMVVT
jgi:hypothetical protein